MKVCRGGQRAHPSSLDEVQFLLGKQKPAPDTSLKY